MSDSTSVPEDFRFTMRAEVPKENLQVLDTVLNELFGTLSSKMKEAGEFLESVKMRPPQLDSTYPESVVPNNSDETDEEDSELDPDSDVEQSDEESDGEEETEEEEEVEDVEEEEEDETEENDEEVEHVFMVWLDGEVAGYSNTLRGAMDYLEEEYSEFLFNHPGLFRTERNQTSVTVYRRTPYLWFMFSEQPVFEGKIQVVAKV